VGVGGLYMRMGNEASDGWSPPACTGTGVRAAACGGTSVDCPHLHGRPARKRSEARRSRHGRAATCVRAMSGQAGTTVAAKYGAGGLGLAPCKAGTTCVLTQQHAEQA
jgi:hypothetical protein